MNWITPAKPAEITETRLIEAILSGYFPVNTTLPGERELATQLGVTRPTLREALQRLARDGWIEIQHGKPTRICNYWEEGSLGVLAAIARHANNLPEKFIENLLAVRALLAPAYARAAVENQATGLIALLADNLTLPAEAEAYAQADWALHHHLTIASGNPVFTLILNGFRELYPALGRRYFRSPAARTASHDFYRHLQASAAAGDPHQAETVTRQAMLISQQLWAQQGEGAGQND